MCFKALARRHGQVCRRFACDLKCPGRLLGLLGGTRRLFPGCAPSVTRCSKVGPCSCIALSCLVLSWLGLSCRVVSCVSCRVVSYRVVSCPSLSKLVSPLSCFVLPLSCLVSLCLDLDMFVFDFLLSLPFSFSLTIVFLWSFVWKMRSVSLIYTLETDMKRI